MSSALYPAVSTLLMSRPLGTAVCTGPPAAASWWPAVAGKPCYSAKRTAGLEPVTLGLGSRCSTS